MPSCCRENSTQKKGGGGDRDGDEGGFFLAIRSVKTVACQRCVFSFSFLIAWGVGVFLLVCVERALSVTVVKMFKKKKKTKKMFGIWSNCLDVVASFVVYIMHIIFVSTIA